MEVLRNLSVPFIIRERTAALWSIALICASYCGLKIRFISELFLSGALLTGSHRLIQMAFGTRRDTSGAKAEKPDQPRLCSMFDSTIRKIASSILPREGAFSENEVMVAGRWLPMWPSSIRDEDESTDHSDVQVSAGALLRWLLAIACGAYPLVVFLVQIAHTINGTQGVDFAIYAQIIHRFAAEGLLETSLIDLHYRHFLTHHFSPYLYLIGWCARFTGDVPLTLIGLHAAAIALSMLGIIRLLKSTRTNPLHELLFLSLFILLPARRIGLLWEVHDEVYAIPLIIWALYAIKHSRILLLIAMMLGLALVKETLFLTISMLACTAILSSPPNQDLNHRRGTSVALLLIFCTGIVAFFLYTRFLPGRVFQSTFDGFQRVSTCEQLLAPSIIKLKLWWVTALILPILPILWQAISTGSRPHRFKQLLVPLLPALPSVAAILVSNFSGMFEPYNYYSILPASLLLATFAIAHERVAFSTKTLLIALMIAAMLGPKIKISSQIREALQFSPHRSIHQIVPENSVVITGDYGASNFYAHRQMIRLYHANKNLVRFDYIAINKAHPERLSLYLRSWSEPFYEDTYWVIRRALPSKAASGEDIFRRGLTP